MVAVSKDAVDLIGSTMYSELQDEAKGTFGFGKTDNLVDTAKDYYSGMSDQEKQNAKNALSAYNDQQFSDFVSQDEVYGGGSASDDNNNDGCMGLAGYWRCSWLMQTLLTWAVMDRLVKKNKQAA